ncbi:glycosyltransferase family 4 protein [Wenzhouxiangella sp. XN79A]|uniref:glycosyltransferase family 4 protein n=1 Tax=Wenzhouxiangella sp. XN79A TaxID=2724193 RepID=UPI00144A7E88|nr:glycosyltransferase family 4 protein [Wenzhouxiangella sp. XN79A]NKI36435.1 glycosyltransferase family 4 protein [Wenzhouxiangella sp. XN79A]
MRREIWIWQNVLSPHMAPLAAALAERGHRVRYIAQQLSLAERSELGWTPPSLGRAELVHCPTPRSLERLAYTAHAGIEHLFQGFRGNGYLAQAYKALGRRNLSFWVFLETVDDRGWKCLARRAYYRRMFARWNPHLQGVLATGFSMPRWVIDRGMPEARIFPFTYFLPDQRRSLPVARGSPGPYRIMFVGKLIERKALDVLLTALSRLKANSDDIQLLVVGMGPEERALKGMAERLGVSGLVSWLGSRKIDEIPALMANADLFVLPSRFDGWGAVVTEALMVGTPAIATAGCGSAEAVQASGCGEVVPAGDVTALQSAIESEFARGRVSAEFRSQLAGWAHAFSADRGADYLSGLFDAAAAGASPPAPPWKAARPPERSVFQDTARKASQIKQGNSIFRGASLP